MVRCDNNGPGARWRPAGSLIGEFGLLTLKHYELLTVLAQELHFGRAAQRLGISQPMLTQQLKQMEDIVGTLL
ncbi:LysR family transcriptional regulator, partial [Roseomonas sp. DSM 102946]|nr:LysR family transcriptional regulator [Roseomonas sp. DSM 102946]